MEIKLNVKEINAVFKMAKQFINPKDARSKFTQIQIRIKDKMLSAFALNGCSIGIIEFPYAYNDAEEGSMMIPLLPLFKKDASYCNIIQNEKEITFQTYLGSQSYRRVDGDPFDGYERFLPSKNKKVDTFYFNPKRLATALAAFSDNKVVKIDYYGASDGVIITNGNKTVLVLPINPKGYES